MICTQAVEKSFKEIVANIPEGKIAMFEITCVPSSMDADRWLGTYVYGTRAGRLIDLYTHKFIQMPSSLRFAGYVLKNW